MVWAGGQNGPAVSRKAYPSIDGANPTKIAMTSDDMAHMRHRLDAGCVIQIECDQQMLRTVARFERHLLIAQPDEVIQAMSDCGVRLRFRLGSHETEWVYVPPYRVCDPIALVLLQCSAPRHKPAALSVTKLEGDITPWSDRPLFHRERRA